MATRGPRSTRPVDSATGMSSRSLKVCARITPTSLNSASYMRSAPASAPVCETAACAPASERPILNATTGLPARAAFSAAWRKRSGWRTLSTYNAMTRVASSSARWSTKSARSRSTSLLVEISLDRPMPRAAARESSAPRMPPLCETTPTGPAGKWSISSAPLAESTMLSVRLTRPMVFGPSRRMLPAASRSCAWRRAPSSPVSV